MLFRLNGIGSVSYERALGNDYPILPYKGPQLHPEDIEHVRKAAVALLQEGH